MKVRAICAGAVTPLLTLCALLTTGLLVKQQFFAKKSQNEVQTKQVADWKEYANAGHRNGPAIAPVVITEFSDFECPFCAQFARTVNTIRERYPDKVAVVFRHYPLPFHAYAAPAARASECAGAQGKFESFHDKLFTNQAAFGIKSWTEFARDAGVADVSAFDRCMKSTVPLPNLVADAAAAQKLGVHGTPTILINGLEIEGGASLQEVERHVVAALNTSN